MSQRSSIDEISYDDGSIGCAPFAGCTFRKMSSKRIKLEHSGDATLKMLEPALSITAIMMGGTFDDVGSHMRERGFKKSQSGNKLQDNIPTK